MLGIGSLRFPFACAYRSAESPHALVGNLRGMHAPPKTSKPLLWATTLVESSGGLSGLAGSISSAGFARSASSAGCGAPPAAPAPPGSGASPVASSV
eukprot:2505105-Pyramimonas_sp.AAC.1